MKSLAALLLVVAASSARADTVYTDVSDVRACLPLDGGATLAGTGGGLARIASDGRVQSVWTSVDGLPGTRIESIASLAGELWIGTESGAAQVRLDGASLAIVRRADSGPVLDIARIGGTRYLATRDRGVLALGPRGATPIPMRGTGAARLRATSLALVGDQLYAGTGAGLFHLTRGTFEHVASPLDIEGLLADGDDLWIASTHGVFALRGSSLIPYGDVDARHLAKLDGSIVAAVQGGGLVRADRGRLAPVAGFPRGAFAQTIGASDSGACAGSLAGIYLRAGTDWSLATRTDAPPANDISALALDGDSLYVGTFDHGLAVFAKGSWSRISDAHLDVRINALLVDRAHRVWVATSAGLSLIDHGAISQLTRADGLPARSVLSLAELSDGRIVAGTTSGAAILGAGRPILLGVKQNVDVANVWAVSEDAAGWLWLGTTTGLYRGRADDSSPWQRFSVATGALRDDWVMALAPHGPDMFVGTYKGGLTRFDSALAATQLGTGWINPGGLRWVGDTLYASTMEGLLTTDGATASWKPIGGLPGKDTTATLSAPHSLFVATRRGLVELTR